MSGSPDAAWLQQIETDHEALLAAIVGALPEPFFVLDREGRYIAVLGGLDNTRYHDGRPLVGTRMHDVLPAETADRFLECVHEALDTGRVIHHEYALSSDDVKGVERRPDVPDHLWFEGHIAPLPAAEGRAEMVVWMIFNVTESRTAMLRLEQQQRAMEAQQRELERLARTDQLTGVLNRRTFLFEADRELQWVRRTGEPAAMILFDLDHFKAINDTSGHAAGDAALRAVGELLRVERRATDLIGRLGGEEFALVIRGSDAEAGARAAERLRSALSTLEVRHEASVLSVTASLGVTEVRAGDARPEDALRRADAAMYRAKRLGRNQVVVDTERPCPTSATN